MSGEEVADEGLTEPNNTENNLPQLIAEAGITAATGLPPQVQKSFWKVVSRVFVASAEWPAKYLEGKGRIATARAGIEVAKYEAQAADIKSQQKARDLINRNTAKVAAERFVAPELADRAVEFHAAHILREQQNRESVLKFAAEELNKEAPKQDSTSEIDDDWLFAFMREASTRTDDDYRRAFGRILAGEIVNPGRFSQAGVQAFSRLDKTTADIFRRACNLGIRVGSTVRIVSDPFATIGTNGLSDCGLSYDNAARLIDYDLLRGEFDEENTIPPGMLAKGVFIEYANTHLIVKSKKDNPSESELNSIKLRGPSLTSIGLELYSIVSLEPSHPYLSRIAKWMDDQGYVIRIFDKVAGIYNQVHPEPTAVT